MKKFDLFFPKPAKDAFGTGAESIFMGQVAYVEVVEPYCDGSDSHGMVKSGGRILLYHEAASAEECCNQIDSLIQELQRLKSKARQKFDE